MCLPIYHQVVINDAVFPAVGAVRVPSCQPIQPHQHYSMICGARDCWDITTVAAPKHPQPLLCMVTVHCRDASVLCGPVNCKKHNLHAHDLTKKNHINLFLPFHTVVLDISWWFIKHVKFCVKYFKLRDFNFSGSAFAHAPSHHPCWLGWWFYLIPPQTHRHIKQQMHHLPGEDKSVILIKSFWAQIQLYLCQVASALDAVVLGSVQASQSNSSFCAQLTFLECGGWLYRRVHTCSRSTLLDFYSVKLVFSIKTLPGRK